MTLSNNLTIDALVNCPDLTETIIFTFDAELLIPNSTRVYDMFWSDKTTHYHTKNPAEDGTDRHHDYYVSTTGDSLICGSSIIGYNTSFSDRILRSFHWNHGYNYVASNSSYNADKYDSNNIFNFKSIEESYSYISSRLKELGISISPSYDCYSLDYKTLSEQSSYLGVNHGYSWTNSDNSYFFILRQEIHGLPVTTLMHGNADDGSMVSGSDIQVLISADGIQKLMCAFIYDTFEETRTPVAIIPLENAIRTVECKYSNIITSSPITITHIELCYLPCKHSNQFKIIPTWIFKSTQEDPNTGKINICYVFVDATTGKEIV